MITLGSERVKKENTGAELNIVVLGYFRPEKNYPSLGKSTSGVTDDTAIDSSLFNDTTQQPASVV